MKRAVMLSLFAAALVVWAATPSQSAVRTGVAGSVSADAGAYEPAVPPPPVPLGTAFTYQGQLRRGGAPHNGTCDFNFSLWDQATSGTQIGSTNAITGVSVVNGLFTVQLDFGDVFYYETRYLKIEVKCAGEGSFTALSPRQRAAPAPIALALPGVHTPQLTDAGGNQTVNVIGGRRTNVIGGPAPYYDNVIAGGLGNTILDNSIQNAVGGGYSNTIQIDSAANVIGGGATNRIDGSSNSAIGGGTLNRIIKFAGASAIAGGEANTIGGNADHNVIGGGQANAVRNESSFNVIGGGMSNAISQTSRLNFIGSGEGNQIESVDGAAAIVGGHTNRIAGTSVDSFIGAGMNNRIVAGADFSVIGGGIANTIAADATADFIGAGESNRIVTLTHKSVIGGGTNNAIEDGSSHSVIGGGMNNLINTQADYATIPGGENNAVKADYGFAAGRNAQALHQGAFVWADSQAVPAASTGPDEFVIRAQGGVRMPAAGVNTPTSMFIHPTAVCPLVPWATPILNPLTLNRPGAILVVTPLTPQAPILGGPPVIGPVAVMYDAGGLICGGPPGVWLIYNQYGGGLAPFYNVFVVNP